MKKIFFLSLMLIVISVGIYYQVQWNYINTTEDVPYKNLGDASTGGGCLVNFFIKYKGHRYPVVVANADADVILTSNKLTRLFIFPLYLNEVIRHGWSIDVDDKEYDRLMDGIVDEKLIAIYNRKDLVLDTAVIANYRIKGEFAGEHAKAILYVLLNQGINCCQDDESGVIRITPRSPRGGVESR